MSVENPCMSCGACCAFFRVSFYWGETDDCPGGTVPAGLTTAISPHRVAMIGTHHSNPLCIALRGQVGHEVNCSIHPQRSSTCRDFACSWETGEPNPDCDRARARFGLDPLQLQLQA